MNIEKLIKVVKLTKHTRVEDSDKLKQMTYKFAQMGNYFDRANSLNSRQILSKEDDQKYTEFYNYGLQVFAQLKQEVEGIKKSTNPKKDYSYSFDNETLNLLKDGTSRLSSIAQDRRDAKGKALANKISDLIREYKRGAYDSVKAKDVPVGFDPVVETRRIISWRNIHTPKSLKTEFDRYGSASGSQQAKLQRNIIAHIEEVQNDYDEDKTKTNITPKDLKEHYSKYNNIINAVNAQFGTKFRTF